MHEETRKLIRTADESSIQARAAPSEARPGTYYAEIYMVRNGGNWKSVVIWPDPFHSEVEAVAFAQKKIDEIRNADQNVDVHSTSAGRKNDQGKCRYDLVPERGEEEFVRVLTLGAQKYGANNWQHVDDARGRYYAALRRHLKAWRLGERRDPEWSRHHLAHAMCCLAFLLELDLKEEATPRPDSDSTTSSRPGQLFTTVTASVGERETRYVRTPEERAEASAEQRISGKS
jgi:hypothetical protein